MYKNYLKQKQIEWKETAEENKKKKIDRGLFSPGWLYLDVVARGLCLAPL
jgi:hypothetical protein